MNRHGADPRGRAGPVEMEEERAWVRFYRLAGDPAMAAEILTLLDTDWHARHEHMALYLLCRESLRSHAMRRERDRRIGRFVRLACTTLVVTPLRALRRAVTRGTDLAVECLPETAPAEPAVAQLRRLDADDRQAPAASDAPLPAPPVEEMPAATGTDATRPA